MRENGTLVKTKICPSFRKPVLRETAGVSVMMHAQHVTYHPVTMRLHGRRCGVNLYDTNLPTVRSEALKDLQFDTTCQWEHQPFTGADTYVCMALYPLWACRVPVLLVVSALFASRVRCSGRSERDIPWPEPNAAGYRLKVIQEAYQHPKPTDCGL
jgi:hypothetical protein